MSSCHRSHHAHQQIAFSVIYSDWTSAVPHGTLKQSQLLHLLHPPAHREHFCDLEPTFPSAPPVVIVAFQHQETPMSNPLLELVLVLIFSTCKTSDQDTAAANAVSQWDTHRPAAALSLPAARYLPSRAGGAWAGPGLPPALDHSPALTGLFLL